MLYRFERRPRPPEVSSCDLREVFAEMGSSRDVTDRFREAVRSAAFNEGFDDVS